MKQKQIYHQVKTSKRRKKTATGKQASLDLASPSGYHLPSPALLAEPNETLIAPDAEALDNTSRMLEGVLSEFGIGGNIEKARSGPVVTRYELNPAPGTKTQRVISLSMISHGQCPHYRCVWRSSPARIPSA